MMNTKKNLINRLVRSRKVALRQIVSVVFPRLCFNAVMEEQKGFGPFCTLSFDCDFPRDIKSLPQLIALLERYKFTASFACIGRWIREFPEAHRSLVAAGHELINHTETHPNLFHPEYEYACREDYSSRRFNQISFGERAREIERCNETCNEVLDYQPIGFRAPHFGVLHVDDVYAVLRNLGYAFSSSTLAAASPGRGIPFKTPENVWEFPVSPCPEHPFGVFDSWHSLGKHGATHRGEGELSGLFAVMGETVQREGGYINVYFDPWEGLESGELERILEYLRHNSIPVLVYGALFQKLRLGDAGESGEPALDGSLDEQNQVVNRG